MTVSVTLNTQVAVDVASQNDLSIADSKVNVGKQTNWVNGTLAGQASKVYASQRYLAASASESLDLAGSLVDPNNLPCVFAKVVAIYIRANDANVDPIVVGNAANPFIGPWGATGTVTLYPGTETLAYRNDTGWTVTPATGDLLKVLNGGSNAAGVGYQIVIVGA